MTTRRRTIRDVFWAFGIAAIVVAYLSQWEARYADPVVLAGAGLLLGLGIIVLEIADTMEAKWPSRIAAVLAALFLIPGMLLTSTQMNFAESSSIANDSRCLAIQADMLSAKPRRDDGPDLFQALGCRPQGEGSVFAPPAAARNSIRDTTTAERKK